jgi:cytochrome c biogenesis protein CcdA
MWLLGMAGLYTCFGLVGVVFGNILQSTRGMMSIAIGAALAHAGWHALETRVDPQTLVRRLLAAALMTAAIALYVLDLW